MKGLEISKLFYSQFGKEMLETEFSEVKNKIAVGLVGEGSECFGYDDNFSTDHDYEAGFCLFITPEDYVEFGFKLERAYAKLPKEFMGLKRSVNLPVGGNRHGVIVIDDFYKKYLGASYAPDSEERWLYTPSHSLACACNGEVFTDELGQFSKTREILKKGYPEDIRLKKLSANLILMAQAGQYNYSRCVSRGETGSAQLAVFEFVKRAISAVYLLNGAYEPFYKWAYKGMRSLAKLSDLEFALIGLTESGNGKKEVQQKIEIIEDVSSIIISELKSQGITKATCNNLERHAYSVQDCIRSSSLRNLHVMEGV